MAEYRLYLGDCLEILRTLPPDSVDAVICDLPYGTTNNAWDSIIPLDLLWAEYKRVCTSSAPIILTAQMPFAAELVMSNRQWFRHDWVWDKGTGTGFLNAKRAPLKSHEMVLVFCRKKTPYHPQMRSGEPYTRSAGPKSTNYGVYTDIPRVSNGERYPLSILRFKRDNPRIHPTQKPVALMTYLVRTYTKSGDLVLDNCMGSGTTGVASMAEDRHFIGIERDPIYLDIAEHRIAAVPHRLFAMP